MRWFVGVLIYLGMGSPAVFAEIKGKDVIKECTSASDCTIVSKSCCSCNNGGENMAIAVKAEAAHKTKLGECKDILCTMNYRCKNEKAACEAGRCVLVPDAGGKAVK